MFQLSFVPAEVDAGSFYFSVKFEMFALNDK